MEQISRQQDQINEDLRIAETRRIRENELLKEKLQIVGKTFDAAKKQVEIDKTILTSLSNQLKILSDQNLTADQFIVAQEKYLDLQAEQVKNLNLTTEAAKKHREIQEAFNKVLKDTSSTQEDIAAASKKANIEMEK